MHDARFLQSTRGRIVTALRRRRSASAIDLAEEFGLSANAVRQQLVALERAGYVAERAVRRGPTKPTLEYSLTESAEAFFPHRYDKMLNAVLREVKETFGDDGLDRMMVALGERQVEKVRDRIDAGDVRGRVRQLAEALRDQDLQVEIVDGGGGTIELREHTCPYGKTVAEHPQLCGIIHTVLHATVSEDAVQLESLATGGSACRFEIPALPGAAATRRGYQP